MSAAPAGDLDGESLAWLRRLGAGGGDRRAAELGLHARLVRIALVEVRRWTGGMPVPGQELDDLARKAADNAMLALLDKLGDFSGESRFITWACRFLILEAAQFDHRYPSAALKAGQRQRRPPTRPHDTGCVAAMAVLCAYVDLAAVGQDAPARYPGAAAHLAACGPCGENLAGLLLAVTIA